MIKDQVADAIQSALTSPAELDRNMEPANVVDGLFAIARALDRCATAIEDTCRVSRPPLKVAIEGGLTVDGDGLSEIADAIKERE